MGIFVTRIVSSKLLVPSSGDVGIAIALESFFGFGSETDSDIARFLEVPNKIESASPCGLRGFDKYLASWCVTYLISG